MPMSARIDILIGPRAPISARSGVLIDFGAHADIRARRYCWVAVDIVYRNVCRSPYGPIFLLSSDAYRCVRADILPYYRGPARILAYEDIGVRTDIYLGPARISARADIGAARV